MSLGAQRVGAGSALASQEPKEDPADEQQPPTPLAAEQTEQVPPHEVHTHAKTHQQLHPFPTPADEEKEEGDGLPLESGL